MNKKLFTPIRIGKVEIKNRVIQPSMCVYFNADDGHINDTFCDYLRERAEGGMGMITIPGSPHGKVSSGRPAISDDSYIEDWKTMSTITHEYDVRLFCQIHPAKFQAGRGHQVEAPEDYTQADIDRLVDSYAAAAKRAQAAGVDGAEIHGGHAHEVAMFMSPLYNYRTDEYGGDVRGRAKFPAMIIEGIKKLCGSDYPVIFRISGNEYVEGGRTIEDSAKICRILEKAGADAIHVTSGMPASDGYIAATMDMEDCFNVDAAAYMKQHVSIPVIAVNRIVDIKEAVDIVECGKADMVAMARGHLADAQLVNKYLGINKEPVRRCVGCNQGCRDNAVRKKIICMQNPFLGFSRERILKPAKDWNRKILIAGAGPAGLEAACDLAARGYQPQVYEKTMQAGGLIALASKAPRKGNLDSIREYRVEYLKQRGIPVHYGVEVTEALLEKEQPNVLIVATGSMAAVPAIPGIDGENVYLSDDVLNGQIPEGERIAVMGGGLVGCETADYLAYHGKIVELIDGISELAKNLNPGRRYFMLKRMAESPIHYHLKRMVSRIRLPEVVMEGEEGTEVLKGIDALVVASGRKPVNELSQLAGRFPDMKIITIGDAYQVGMALDAIHQAAVAACGI